MNNFDKPKLVEKNLLKTLFQKNIKKNNSFVNSVIQFLKSNGLIILSLLILVYFLYYRYNSVNKKYQNNIQSSDIPEMTPRYGVNPIIQKQVHQQTRFIPADQQYAVPQQPIQPPYLKNINSQRDNYNVSDEYNNSNELNNIKSSQENEINPINLNQNYLYESNNYEDYYPNENDYSLKAQSSIHLPQQYIGHNYAPVR